MHTSRQLTLTSAKAEILSVVVTSKSGKNICFSTLYRVGTLGAENLTEVKRHVLSIASSNSLHKHIFVGDFNLSNTTWPNGTSSSTDEKGYLDLFNDLGLAQFINEPTHSLGNTLDLLLCNNNQMITDVNVLPKNTICNYDHFGIKFKVKLLCKRLKNQKRRIYNFKKADFKSINNDLNSINWGYRLNTRDIDKAVSNFECTFISICDRYIPKITLKSNFQPPWFDSELDGICKKKNKLLNKYKRTKDPLV